jgi:hypothetical protein
MAVPPLLGQVVLLFVVQAVMSRSAVTITVARIMAGGGGMVPVP